MFCVEWAREVRILNKQKKLVYIFGFLSSASIDDDFRNRQHVSEITIYLFSLLFIISKFFRSEEKKPDVVILDSNEFNFEEKVCLDQKQKELFFLKIIDLTIEYEPVGRRSTWRCLARSLAGPLGRRQKGCRFVFIRFVYRWLVNCDFVWLVEVDRSWRSHCDQCRSCKQAIFESLSRFSFVTCWFFPWNFSHFDWCDHTRTSLRFSAFVV